MGSLPPTLKQPIEQFLHVYYIDGRRFVYEGKELTPMDITKYGGSLLATHINYLGNHAVLLAPMCEQILYDNELKKDFIAEAKTKVTLRAWEYQQSAIKTIAEKYVMAKIVNHFVAGKHRFFSHRNATKRFHFENRFSPIPAFRK